MRFLIKHSIFLFAILLFSCGGSESASTNQAVTEKIVTVDSITNNSDLAIERRGIPSSNDITIDLPEQHNCVIDGEVYEGNEQWFRAKNILVAITADASTFDESLGESHRLLLAYDAKDCKEIFREVLPVSVSADYPYYLTPIDSIKGELVGVLGTDRFYVFDVTNNRLSPALNPEFKSNRQLDDAQSGAIIGMETWGRYVIGYVEDEGSFVYNLTIPESPKQEKAFAEYKQSDERFSALFLLKEAEADQQAILPKYDLNNREFLLNPLLEEATEISQQVNKNALDNRYIVLRMKDEARTPIAIDMEKNERLELPNDMKAKSTQEIISWMKEKSKE